MAGQSAHRRTLSAEVQPGTSAASPDAMAKHAVSDKVKAIRQRYREQRKAITMFRRPLQTIYYSTRETLVLLGEALQSAKERWQVSVPATLAVIGLYYFVSTTTNATALYAIDKVYEAMFWCFLGILSSVGLGTGLHTFILYLGPYMAQYTMHAYTCNSTEFASELRSTQRSTWANVLCLEPPEEGFPPMTVWRVMQNVEFPAFFWGCGAAIGELPPYFVARAARMSEEDPDDEDLEEFHESLHDDSHTLLARAKRFMHDIVQRAGFWGIFFCAAIPNPLFDLAGITCGHFMIPFHVFFGATFLGKAIFKLHIQMAMLVFFMSKPVFEALLGHIKQLPMAGVWLHDVIRDIQRSTQARFVGDGDSGANKDEGLPLLAYIMGPIVIGMIGYFAVSIINQMAQKNRHRLDKQLIEREVKSG